jgi:uncharacterized protein (DUF58 family)
MAAFWRRLLRRDRPEAGPVVLDRHRVYILPTRHGVIFALVLLAMLLGSINYNNSLGYALTFLLTSLAVVSILHTFRNIHKLQLSAGHPQPVFAGEEANFPLQVTNRGGLDRLGVMLRLEENPPLGFDFAADDDRWITLHRHTTQRGYLPLGRITIESTFPLGMFRAWGYANLASRCLVYPEPAPQRTLPPKSEQASGASGDRGRGNDDFSNLRPYQPGDSLRHIHWKALARGMSEPVTKQFGGGVEEELWLRWDQLANMGVEAKLSRLTRWVIEAESQGLAYGLTLPQQEIPPSRGDAHRHLCLEALALYGHEEETE